MKRNYWMKSGIALLFSTLLLVIVSILPLQPIKAQAQEPARANSGLEAGRPGTASTPISMTIGSLFGGTLQSHLANPQVVIHFPAGAVMTETVVTYAENSATNLNGKVDVGRAFSLTATQQLAPLIQFSKPVTIVVQYDAATTDLHNLQLYWLKGTGWITDGITTVSRSTNRLTSTTTYLGQFAVLGERHKAYLPSLANRWPPIPYTMPILNTIVNSDSDDVYTVSWQAAPLAETYVLEEDDNPLFTSPTERYAGASRSWLAFGNAPGTYYYRVKARNQWGDSGWSNIEGVTVRPPQVTVYVDNDTGGQLCYEIYNSGIGRRCFGNGEHLYGTFDAGRYSWKVTARCGSLEGTDTFDPGEWIEQFWCQARSNTVSHQSRKGANP